MRYKHILLMVPAAALLTFAMAGCGGGGDSGNGGIASGSGAASANSAGNNTVQSAATDSFLSQVRSLIASNSDTAEPAAVDATPAPMPDNTEPVPI